MLHESTIVDSCPTLVPTAPCLVYPRLKSDANNAHVFVGRASIAPLSSGGSIGVADQRLLGL